MKTLKFLCAAFCATMIAVTACEPQNPEQPDDPGNTEQPDNPNPEEPNPEEPDPENPNPEEPEKPAVPEIVITTSNGQISINAAGGELSFDYEITNPAEDGVVTLEIPETNEWITSPVIDNKSITITVAENTVAESRSELLTVRYTYRDSSVTAPVNIIQEAGVDEDVIRCTDAASYFHGREFTPGFYTYYLMLGTGSIEEEEPNAVYYCFNLCNLDLSEDRSPIPGTYDMVPYEEWTDFTFDDWNTYAYSSDEEGNYYEYSFVDGSADIKKDGNVYTINITLTDDLGEVHSIRYNGEIAITDLTADREYYSTLEEDLNLDISGTHEVISWFYGDYYEVNMNNYMFVFSTPEMAHDDIYLVFEILTPIDENLSDGFQSLTFDSWYDYTTSSEYLYIPGASNHSYSWVLTIDEYDAEFDQFTIKSPKAPFYEGSLTITSNDDGTINMSAIGYDDKGFEINIHGENMPLLLLDSSSASVTAGKHAYSDPRSTTFRSARNVRGR